MYDITPVTSTKSTVCGPCCMKMLLAYYGVDVTLDELLQERPVTLAGWTGKDVLEVGRAHGLDMLAYKMDAEELIKQDRPAIVWWLYKHFVVFCGVDDKGMVVLCNPAKGRYRVDPGVFKSFYTEYSFWNGEPHDLPVSDTATAEDYEAALSDLGVNV